MTAPELLPCPFCGDADPEQHANVVTCLCGASGPRQDGPEFMCDWRLARDGWNRRTPTPLAAALEVPEVRALVERAYREGWADGACNHNHRTMTQDWLASDALAALKGGAP